MRFAYMGVECWVLDLRMGGRGGEGGGVGGGRRGFLVRVVCEEGEEEC